MITNNIGLAVGAPINGIHNQGLCDRLDLNIINYYCDQESGYIGVYSYCVLVCPRYCIVRPCISYYQHC